jgi:uncharacterized repeat protein (TIGR03803 family)
MPSKERLAVFVASFSLILGSLTITTPLLAASKEKVLYSFCSVSGCADGSGPLASLIFDTSGNLYGTTVGGGAYGHGAVFELTPKAGGVWTEKVLYSFCPTSGCPDGRAPQAGLIFGSAGNLYGTTYYGGSEGQQCYPTGCGTVFELIPHNGNWSEKVLHRFCPTSNCPDGGFPSGGVIFDTAGNLYGTAKFGGTYYYGSVFELKPHNGEWTAKTLHNFNNNGKDGYYPNGGLVMDTAGNLYGTTPWGGTHLCDHGAVSCGTVFELIAQNGKWAERVLHSFDGPDGQGPDAGLTLDATGTLYGSTSTGGTSGDGTVFELTSKGGRWTERVLHNFVNRIYTVYPWQVILDPAGNVYGTTNSDGAYGVGTVFELIPNNGKWTEKVLHTFGGKPDGRIPDAGLIRDNAGNVYGTTGAGGAHNGGTVFKVTP